jgi:chromosome segregation ATPase
MSQYENPKELIINFQDVEHLVDGLSKDLIALFVEVDHELVDVLVYAVREHFAVIPYKPQRTIKFTLRNLYKHETLGDAKLRMSLLNNFDGSLEQTLYLDGMEKYRLESQSYNDKPFVKLVYEWRESDPDPDKESFDEVRYIIEQARASHLETEEAMREVEYHFAFIARNSVERMLVKQVHVNDFKQVTTEQHNKSKMIFTNVEEFSKKEGENLRSEVDSINAKAKEVEAQIRKLEEELSKEENTLIGYEKDVHEYVPIKINSNVNRNTEGRYNIKEEVVKVTHQIQSNTLQNVNKSKEDGLLWGLEQTNTKLALFDDILSQQSKVKDVRIKLEVARAEIRDAHCDLAAKEFELNNLESESAMLADQDKDLNMKIRESEEALQAMLADRKDASERGAELEARASEYETLLAKIEAEVNELKAASEKQKELGISQDLFASSGKNNPKLMSLQDELNKAEAERDDALNRIEAMEGAWIESVEEVSKEAEKLVADPQDSKLGKDVQKLLKDILDASNRSADHYKVLEITDQKINLMKAADKDALLAELAKDIKARNKRLSDEEKVVVDNINNGVTSLEKKIGMVDKEQSKIPQLQDKLEKLLREREELILMIEELTLRLKDKEGEEAERERKYQRELQEYNRRVEQINVEIRKLQSQIAESNSTIKNLQMQITQLEEELETWYEKIKIKKTLVKKKMDADALEDEYVPAPNDPIDLKIANFKNKKITRIPIKRIEPGEYMFATMRVQIYLDGKQPSNYSVKMLKTNKVYDLENFIRNEANEEIEKISRIQEDQEIVVDESEKTEIRRSPKNRNSNSPSRGTQSTFTSKVVTTEKITRYRG